MPPSRLSKDQKRRGFHEKEESRKPIFGKGPNPLRSALADPTVVSGPGPKPNSGELAMATLPEWYVYWALMRLGKRPRIDFSFRGRTSYASLSSATQLDFTMLDGSYIAIEVQGTYYHYQQGSAKLVQDTVRAGALASTWKVIFIDEDDVVGDDTGQAAIYYVKEALAGRDHSWRYRGFLRHNTRVQ